MVILVHLKMALLYMMILWKEVLQATPAILALDLMVMIKGFVRLMQHGQEQCQYA